MKNRSKKILSYILTLAVLGGTAYWVASRFIHWGDVEFTDNAQVNQQIVPVNSRVQGYIKEIRFKEYEPVKKGDTLVVIDDSDLRLNVVRAWADYANATAPRSVADRSVSSASANVAVSEATIEEARIVMEMASTDLRRYEKLLEKDAVTRQQFDAAKTDYEAKKARYNMHAQQKNASFFSSGLVDYNSEVFKIPFGDLFGMVQRQAVVVSMKEIYGWLLMTGVVSLLLILTSFSPVRPWAIFPKWKTIRRNMRHEAEIPTEM